MKKFNLKNAFTAAGIAVFAGVLTIGVNAAIGVSSPTEVPNNSALVSPTFNGVDVQGGIKNTSTNNEGLFTINDHAAVTGDFALAGNMFAQKNITLGYPTGGAETGTLEVYNKIIHPDITKPLVLDDDVEISGAISNPTIFFSKMFGPTPAPVTIDDNLSVTGTSIVNGETQANGGLKVNGAPLNVSTEAQFLGGISMYGGNIHGVGTDPVSIGSNLNTTGTITSTGAITSGGALVSNGDLSIGTQAINKKFLFHTRTNGNGDFLQITNDDINGNWDWNNGIILMRGGNVGIGTKSPNAKLSVNGKVTATGGFGSLKQYVDTKTILPSTMSSKLTSSCNEGQILLSCGVSISGDGYVNTIYPMGFSCYAYVHNNNDSVNATVKVYARCLDYAN